MGAMRSQTAVVVGLLAWAAFAVMVVAPWFEDEADFWMSPSLSWAITLTLPVFALALISFALGNSRDRAGVLASWLSTLAALALLLYWTIPWAWSILNSDY
jgi:hypothetical protein